MQISDTEYGATHVEEPEPAEQQPATSAFPSKWLNKLTSLLSKRVRNFSAWVIWKPAVGD